MFNFSPSYVSKHTAMIMLLVLFIFGSITFVESHGANMVSKYISTRHNYAHLVSVFL